MSETPKKRAEIVSAFTDHGTGERFEAGATPLIDAGAFANYEAAGLVRTPSTKKAADTKAPAKKPIRKRTARASAPAAAPVPAEPAPAPAAGAGDASA